MRILILSDTHGNIERVPSILEKLNNDSPLDLIVHCGDYSKDGSNIANITTLPVISVKGNCDLNFSKDNFELLDTEAGPFIVTHGHMESASYSLEGLYDLAIEKNAIGVIFGHTHRSIFTNVRGIYMINPGSLTKPRDLSNGTFAVLETGDNEYVNCSIYDYTNFMSAKPKKKTKVQTGHLSSMINYSDRF